MSHALIATGTALRGRMLSALLLFALVLIWQNGDGARSQRPARDANGTLSLAIHPEEGLRQLVQHVQKRGTEERKSGALPDPVILLAQGLLLPHPGHPRAAPAAVDLPPPMAPRRARLARAPPRRAA